MRTNTALLSLSVGAFAIGATEFSPMGMLPEIAGSLAVSIPAAGMLVVVYALGVMLGAPVMTLLLIRRSPKAALIFLMSIFTAGNVLSALAPDYNTLLFARFITSLNHGAFFGIGAMVATRVVAKGKEAGAIAGMFMGLTIANIGGVPAITKLSQMLGWRESFFVVSLLGLLTMAALLRSLPRNMQGQELNLRRELGTDPSGGITGNVVYCAGCQCHVYVLYLYCPRTDLYLVCAGNADQHHACSGRTGLHTGELSGRCMGKPFGFPHIVRIICTAGADDGSVSAYGP